MEAGDYLKGQLPDHPNHLQKKFKSYQKYEIKNAIKLLNSSLCLPSSTNIKISDLKKVIKALYV